MSIIYTIGYEGTDIDRFLETLKHVGIRRLADVRAVALSRKKGFSKKALAARLAEEGIEYLHFVALGDPKPGRDAARSGLYHKFRAIYGAHLDSPIAQAALGELRNAVSELATCLLCFEREPSLCHRSIVASELSQSGMRVFDLFGDDPGKYVRNAAKVPRFDARQGVAAA